MKRSQNNLVVPALAVAAALAFVALWGRGEGGAGTSDGSDTRVPVRIAYMENVTHAPAIIGLTQGIWAKSMKDARISTTIVNAGPDAMEAMVAGDVDFCFVGPSPALNTYLKTNGKGLQVIAGVCQGGASLIRRSDVEISKVKDLGGKRVAVPQLGGTQDVSCRHFLSTEGLRAKDQGGNVEIIAAKNGDILNLFKQKELDAAWVPEPWASRIKAETGAVTVVDERELWPGKKFTATVLVVRSAFEREHPDIVREAISANAATLGWIKANENEAKALVNAEQKKFAGQALQDEVLDEAWSRVVFTADPDQDSVKAFALAAAEAGYSKDSNPNLSELFRPSQGVAKR